MYPRQQPFYTGHNDADLPPERTHRRKKRRKTARIVITAILLCLAVTAGWQLRKLPDREIISDILSSISGETMSQLNSTETEENGWQLILVNREHPLSDNYQVELTELSNGEKVAASIYPALQQMFDDMRAEGIYPVVVSGYRTDEEQQQILNDKTASYRAEGYSDADASALAEDWVLSPAPVNIKPVWQSTSTPMVSTQPDMRYTTGCPIMPMNMGLSNGIPKTKSN